VRASAGAHWTPSFESAGEIAAWGLKGHVTVETVGTKESAKGPRETEVKETWGNGEKGREWIQKTREREHRWRKTRRENGRRGARESGGSTDSSL